MLSIKTGWGKPDRENDVSIGNVNMYGYISSVATDIIGDIVVNCIVSVILISPSLQ
jgi:uncharacterized protein with ACT and thioredoxin-like domain